MLVRALSGLIVAACVATSPALGIDQPISAVKLILARSPSSNREKLIFLSRDPAALFPSIASADDPATGTPGGATIDLFSQQGAGTLNIPAGAGQPGWSVNAGAQPSFKFGNTSAPNGISPVRLALVKQGTILKITARDTGLLMGAGMQGSVGIRITMGTLRNCAHGGVVYRDEPNKFIAKQLVATGLADCSNTSLGGEEPPSQCTGGDPAPTCGGTCPAGSDCSTQDLLNCICIDSAQPCGDTYPVCNGECPVGEECLATGGAPLTQCDCLPTGSVPCGQFNCGGDCPAAEECNYFERSTPGLSGCECGPPGPCDGSGGDDCPPGYHCAFGPFPPNYYFCAPD